MLMPFPPSYCRFEVVDMSLIRCSVHMLLTCKMFHTGDYSKNLKNVYLVNLVLCLYSECMTLFINILDRLLNLRNGSCYHDQKIYTSPLRCEVHIYNCCLTYLSTLGMLHYTSKRQHTIQVRKIY